MSSWQHGKYTMAKGDTLMHIIFCHQCICYAGPGEIPETRFSHSSCESHNHLDCLPRLPQSTANFKIDDPSAATSQSQIAEPESTEPRHPFTIELCAPGPMLKRSISPANTPQQHHSPWLKAIHKSVHTLAAKSTSHRGRATLVIPWICMARDLLQLLPTSSWYSSMMEDDALITHFISQLTQTDANLLTLPGCKMMAGIIKELAQHNSVDLCRYASVHEAVLHRLEDVCTSLVCFETAEPAEPASESCPEAAAYTVAAARCLLVSSYKAEPQQALKSALHLVRLLPLELCDQVCVELLLSEHSNAQIFLQDKRIPAHMAQAQFSLACEIIKSHLALGHKLSAPDATKICKWAVWQEQQTGCRIAPATEVAMAQLAYLADTLALQTNFNKLVKKARTKTPLQEYVGLLRVKFQPSQLKACVSTWHIVDKDEQTAQLVHWMALLSSNMPFSTSQRADWSHKAEALDFLQGTAALGNPDAVKEVSLNSMTKALQQLHDDKPLTNKLAGGVQPPSSQKLPGLVGQGPAPALQAASVPSKPAKHAAQRVQPEREPVSFAPPASEQAATQGVSSFHIMPPTQTCNFQHLKQSSNSNCVVLSTITNFLCMQALQPFRSMKAMQVQLKSLLARCVEHF